MTACKNRELLASELPPGKASYLAASLEAMRRAARQARKVAEQTGTDVIVLRDGRLVRVHPAKRDAA